MKNRNTKRLFPARTILLSLFLFSSFLTFAQDVKELRKINKEYIKELKSIGFKSVKIKTGDNGFWYFLVGNKVDGKVLYGVITADKEVLFDCKYTAITYASQIAEDGYTDYRFGSGTVSIYNNAMPGYFKLYDSNTNKISIALVDGSIINEISEDDYILGSWIVTNMKEIVTKFINGTQHLVLSNNETEDMGFTTWDGKQLAKNENSLIEITSKTDDTYNSVFVHANNKVGAFFLEEQSLIVPTEYLNVQVNYADTTFEVRLTHLDRLHYYRPSVRETFVPKNKGQEHFLRGEYKECVDFFCAEENLDPESMFYYAHAEYNIANSIINKLEYYISATLAINIPGYDYNSTKKMLGSAIKLLDIASAQDVERKDIYNEYIETYKSELNRLEVNNSKLELRRYNRQQFRNQLAGAVLTGVVVGVTSGLTNSQQSTSTSSKSNSASTSSASLSSGNVGVYNTSSSSTTSTRTVDHAKIAEWQTRKARAERMIQEYQQQLIKDPNDASIKNMIRSQENIIRNCNEQINRLQGGQ